MLCKRRPCAAGRALQQLASEAAAARRRRRCRSTSACLNQVLVWRGVGAGLGGLGPQHRSARGGLLAELEGLRWWWARAVRATAGRVGSGRGARACGAWTPLALGARLLHAAPANKRSTPCRLAHGRRERGGARRGAASPCAAAAPCR